MSNKTFFQTFVLTCLLFTVSVSLFAQQGSWYIGGQGGFNATTRKKDGLDDIKTNTWNFAPEVGTFLQDDLQLGFALNLSGSEVGDVQTNKFAPVLYLRKFYKVGDRFSTFVGLVGTFSTGKTTIPGVDDFKTSGWGANLAIGGALALSERFTAVGQYGFFGYTSDKAGDVTTSSFGLNVNSLGPVLNVGIYWTMIP